MRMSGVLSILLFIISCAVDQKEIMLPGKVAVSKSDRTCIIYDSIKETMFELRDDKEYRYSGLSWMHRENSFVGVEYLKNNKGAIYKGNIVRFDLTGRIVERIYQANDGELAGDAYLSQNDKKLMFLIEWKGDIKLNQLEGLNRQQSLVIMDFEHRNIIKRVENFGTSMSIEISESPWLYSEDRLVYSVNDDNKISDMDMDINSIAEGTSGVYIFDLNSNQHEKLVSNGRHGICSPVDLQVGFINEKSVSILNLNDNTTKMVYEVKSNQKIADIHWSPDGNYLYVAYHTNPGTKLFTVGEILIELSTGSEIPFRKIKHGFHPYTWK